MGLQSARAREVEHEQATWLKGVMAAREYGAKCRGPAGARSDVAEDLADRNNCRAPRDHCVEEGADLERRTRLAPPGMPDHRL
jgi:hypothetical protein